MVYIIFIIKRTTYLVFQLHVGQKNVTLKFNVKNTYFQGGFLWVLLPTVGQTRDWLVAVGTVRGIYLYAGYFYSKSSLEIYVW